MNCYKFRKYYYILLIFILLIVSEIYGQGNNDTAIKEYFMEKSICNFAITPKYFWAKVLGEGLVKFDGFSFQNYWVDEKSEGPLINYCIKKNIFSGFFSELINYNEDIWLFSMEPKNIIKIENDTIINYPLDKLFQGERKFINNYNIDNFGNLSFLAFSPSLESDMRDEYRICTIDQDSIFIFEIPSIIQNIEYFCSFNNKYYFVSYDNKIKKLYILNNNFNELKEYLLIDECIDFRIKHFFYDNKIFLMNNHGDLYIISDDSLEVCKLEINTTNICFDFLIYMNNLIFSDYEGIFYYDLNNFQKSKLFDLPDKHIGFLKNIKITNNKLYGNYGIASTYTCRGSYTDGFEIINLEK